jgi:hypothetical protein
MKAAIVILSDPRAGDEALGRLLNGLAVAHECKARGDDVRIVFSGAGTRWASELVKEAHPAHKLYVDLEDEIAGVSLGCAVAFGAADDARRAGFEMRQDYALPDTSGVASVRTLATEGYSVLTF